MAAIAYLYCSLYMLALSGSNANLHAVRFLDYDAPAPTAPTDLAACLQAPYEQLKAYFDGELREFDLPCVPTVGTAFQRQV